MLRVVRNATTRVFRPEGEALFKQHDVDFHESDPITRCLPGGPLEILPAGGIAHTRGSRASGVFMDARGIVTHLVIRANEGEARYDRQP